MRPVPPRARRIILLLCGAVLMISFGGELPGRLHARRSIRSLRSLRHSEFGQPLLQIPVDVVFRNRQRSRVLASLRLQALTGSCPIMTELPDTARVSFTPTIFVDMVRGS